uniref:EF-hand domain-containing protein n=1 Tax=Zea mays TaxID=4577 RepID=A0A804LVW4_MAIZE
MWAPSRGSSSGSGRRTWRRRIADYLADDQTDVSDNESFITAHSDEHAAPASGAGGMLPAFLADQGDLVEVMLELDEESMVVRSVTPTAAALCGPTSLPLPGARSLSRCSSTSSRIRRKFAWLRSPSPRPPAATAASDQQVVVREAALAARERRRAQARLDRSRSGARRALKGLRFISRTTGSSDADAGAGAGLWRGVEERFNALATDGLLARDDFGDCIGMVDSKEFAVGIFDALARRRRQNLERISKDELYEFWLQISDQSFDARLQIFFDMVDTNVDGRITREEVQELIVLSASANKLSKLKEQAEEYASLIMEELDPENLGYIELWQLEALLLQRDAYMTYSRPMSSGSAAQWSQGLSGGAGAGGQPSAQQQQGVASRWRRWSPRRAAARARVAAAESWRRAWVLALWVAAMAALFAWRFVQYRRDAQAQHGARAPPRVPQHADVAPLHLGALLRPLRRQHRLPQDHRDGDRAGHLPARGEPPGVRLPAADRVGARGVPSGGALLRAGQAQLPRAPGGRGGRDGDRHGHAHGRVLHPGHAAVPEAGGGQQGQEEGGGLRMQGRPARRLQRLLVLAPPAHRRLPPAPRPRLVHVPRRQVVPEDDVDVHFCAAGALRRGTDATGLPIQGLRSQDSQGVPPAGERPDRYHVEALRVPLQERAVHIPPVSNNLPVRVAPFLHHLSSRRRLRQRPRPDQGRLDTGAQAHLRRELLHAVRAQTGCLRGPRRGGPQDQEPAEVAGRRPLRRPRAGLQELRRAAPRRPRDRRHALHQHPQRPPQQHQAGRRAHGPGNGDRPGRGQRQQPERVDGERRRQQEEGVPNDLRPLLLGHEGAWVVRVVQGGDERGRRDGQ